MSICEDCPIEEKIYVCCLRYPPTGEQVKMVLENGTTLSVCPYLAKNGKCIIYSTRPANCRLFLCDRFLYDELTEKITNGSFFKLFQ